MTDASTGRIADRFRECLELGVGNPAGVTAWSDTELAKAHSVSSSMVNLMKTGKRNFTKSRATTAIRVFTSTPAADGKKLSAVEAAALDRLLSAFGAQNPDWDLQDMRAMLDEVRPREASPDAAFTPASKTAAAPASGGEDWPGPLTVMIAPFGVLLTIAAAQTPIALWVAGFALLTIVFVWVLEVSLRNDAARTRLRSFFDKGSYAALYRDQLLYLLNRYDRFLGQGVQSHPWSMTLHARCLLLAAIYPSIFMLAQWLFLGRDVVFFDRVLLHAETLLVGKTLTAIAYGVSLISLLSASTGKSQRRGAKLAIAALAALLGFFFVAIAFSPGPDGERLTSHFEFGVLFSGTLCCVALILALRAVDVTVAVMFSMTFAGLFVAVFKPELTTIAEGLSSVTRLSPTLLYEVVAQVTLWSGTILGSLILLRPLRGGVNLRVAPYVHSVFVIGSLLAIMLGAGYLNDPIFYILMGLLPIVNSIFDFFSVSLTRWALGQGVAQVGKRTLGFGALDLVIAAVTFLALGCAVVLVLQIANTMTAGISGLPEKIVMPVGASGLFAAIIANVEGHWWFLLALLTTLAPTVLHLCIAIWALGPAMLPLRLRSSATDVIGNAQTTSLIERGTILAALAVWCAGACLLPLGALVLVFHFFESVGAGLLTEALMFFVWFGRILGF